MTCFEKGVWRRDVMKPCLEVSKRTFITSRIAKLATRRTLEFFHRHTSHRPSRRMIRGIHRQNRTMARAFAGSIPAKCFVSSMEPGVGKTRSMCDFIHTLHAEGYLADQGVLICVHRYEDIRAVIETLELPQMSVGVLTSDPGTNSLGTPDPLTAPVLLTTHGQIESRVSRQGPEGLSDLIGTFPPRPLRVWDESILPGEALTLSRDGLAALLGYVRPTCPEYAEALDQFGFDLRSAQDGSTCLVPHCEDFGSTRGDLLQLVTPESTRDRDCMATLTRLSGRAVTVRRDGIYGNTILDFEETLPNEFLPLIVLDASGRVRGTYKVWEEHQDNIVLLPPIAKDYSPCSIHVWEHASGRSAYRRHSTTLATGVATLINSKPTEQFLVIHHGARRGIPDLPTAIAGLVERTPDRVAFLSFGNHLSTNEFRHVPNVVIVGALTYRPSAYEARGRAAAGVHSGSGNYPEHSNRTVIEGELMHHVFQAVCRGTARLCDGDRCHRANVYIVASRQTGIQEALPSVFPGAEVRDWRPLGAPRLMGLVGRAAEVVQRALVLEGRPEITFAEVRRKLGGVRPGNFLNDVRRHELFIAAMEADGIYENGSPQRKTMFTRLKT